MSSTQPGQAGQCPLPTSNARCVVSRESHVARRLSQYASVLGILICSIARPEGSIAERSSLTLLRTLLLTILFDRLPPSPWAAAAQPFLKQPISQSGSIAHCSIWSCFSSRRTSAPSIAKPLPGLGLGKPTVTFQLVSGQNDLCY
jgi:hypothetical protein